jgi:hypothetical protein
MEVAGSGVFGRGSCVLLEMGPAEEEGKRVGSCLGFNAAAGSGCYARAS